MAAILIATDFSEAGNSAAHYGCMLASRLNCTVTILHTYMLPIATADQPYPLISVNDMESIARERMDVMLSELRAACPNVLIESRIAYGDWRDNAEEDTNDHFLAIVGNGGSSDSWLGSNTLDAARNLSKPLLAIPTGAVYTDINKICLAFDTDSMHGLAPLQSLIPILEITGATVLLIHVQRDVNDTFVWDEQVISDVLGTYPFACHNIQSNGSSIDESIHQFAIDSNADWLAIIPHHHSFFHNLFSKSHTRAALKLMDIPVLSVH